MKKLWVIIIPILLLSLFGVAVYFLVVAKQVEAPDQILEEPIQLPAAQHDGPVSLEAALLARRSIRDYADKPLSLAEVSQLLWAAQGITDKGGHRTAPSAGALYPLEIYLLSGEVEDLKPGLYKYQPLDHKLLMITREDRRVDLYHAALEQDPIKDAPAVIVIAAVYERTSTKYGKRAPQYVHIETGSVAQNIYLQATAMSLGTVFIGAFYDEQVKAAVQLAEEEVPLGLMAVGNKR